LGEMGDLFKKRMTSYFREYFINNDDVFYSWYHSSSVDLSI
jgi:hypothetical protein